MIVAYLGIKGLPAKGGAERVVEAIIHRILQRGIIPVVYCDRRYTPEDYEYPGVQLVRLPTIPGKHFQSLSLFLLSAIHSLIFGKYDIIHIHNMESAFLIPLLSLKYIVIGTCHGSAYWRGKWGKIAKGFLKLMDRPFITLPMAITSVSRKDSKLLSNKYNREVINIPNGVGTDYTTDIQSARDIINFLGIKNKKYFLFVAGRIEKTKGAHFAIKAVNELENNSELIVLGDFNQDVEYTNQLKNIAGPKVKFHDLIENPSTVFGLMNQSIAVVFPSEVEAMSMVLLEAASIGVPVICSDIPENVDVLGSSGLYFSNRDLKSLKEKMRWVLSNEIYVKSITGSIQSRVHNRYSWDAIAKDYITLYDKSCRRLRLSE